LADNHADQSHGGELVSQGSPVKKDSATLAEALRKAAGALDALAARAGEHTSSAEAQQK
ncbi:hypothetical protein LTS18_002272, partial [Coniosporium uncinatum]